MSRNLVIVESPAKARTIERYLGPDYAVLASYGHVRDLPENPGKGKLGVDVEHDFAPEYVIPDGPSRGSVGAIERAARERPTGSSSPPTSTARARRSPGTSPRRRRSRRSKLARVTFSEITEPAIRDGVRPSPATIDRDLVDAQQARRIVDRLVGYTLSPLISRKVRVGPLGRAGPVGRRAPRRRARARDPGLHRPRVLDDRGEPRRPGRRAVRAPTSSGSTAQAGDRRRRHGRARTSRGHCRASRPVVDRGRDEDEQAEPGAAVHDLDAPAGGEPQARLQPEAHDVGRPAALRGRRDARRPGRADHLHADRLGRDGRPGPGRGPRGHRGALRRRLHDAEGPRLPDEVEERPGGPRGDPADLVRPRSGGARAAPSAATRRASTASSGSAPSPAR